jgi:large subunit ribosomal protein L29
MMSTKEIREKETEAIRHELADKQKHLFDLRSQAVTEKLEDPSQLRKTKTEIARMKTIIRERELKASAEAEPKKTEPTKKTTKKETAKS